MSTILVDELARSLKALAAAVGACKLYGPQHPSIATWTHTAQTGLVDAVAGLPDGVTIHLIGAHVLAGNTLIPQSAVWHPAIFGPLASFGLNSLRLCQDIDAAELRELVRWLASPLAPGSNKPQLPSWRTIKPGHTAADRSSTNLSGPSGALRSGDAPEPPSVVGASASPAPQLHRPSASLIDHDRLTGNISHLLTSCERAGIPAPRVFDRVVGEICSAVFSAKGSVLELAKLKSHDEYTFVHTVNVGLLAAALAEAVGLSHERVHEITLGALLHDLGKRVIPLGILNKRGKLDPAERSMIENHPVESARLLSGADGIPALAAIIGYEHHMHLDGTGYPSRSPRWRPHIASQIVQLADVFDALRTHRPYRAAMSDMEAAQTMLKFRGTKYDADLLDEFFLKVVPKENSSTPPSPPLAETPPLSSGIGLQREQSISTGSTNTSPTSSGSDGASPAVPSEIKESGPPPAIAA